MMIIHTSFKKRKPRKLTAKQRELQSDWEKLVQKYAPKKSTKPKSDDWVYSLGNPARRETPNIPSLPFSGTPCTKKESNVYTGTAMKGIGTMHKSNAVPIFSDEHAVEIATMRRG